MKIIKVEGDNSKFVVTYENGWCEYFNNVEIEPYLKKIKKERKDKIFLKKISKILSKVVDK